MSTCAGQRSAVHESGGRQPPVVPINADATVIHTHAHTPSAVLRTIALVSAQTCFHTHGGLTPAAPGCGFANRWTMFDFRGTAFGSPIHGGLTPAAPVHVRVCTANGVGASEKSFFRRQTFAPQYKSGGRKPPVGNETSHGLMSTCAGNRSAVHETQERGALAPRGVFSACEPAYGNPAHCRCKRGLYTHGGLTSAAPGECAFVHR